MAILLVLLVFVGVAVAAGAVDSYRTAILLGATVGLVIAAIGGSPSHHAFVLMFGTAFWAAIARSGSEGSNRR